MTALSLELMDITRDWVSSFVMIFQAFTAADFSCCLFVGLSAFSFVFSKWNACSIGLRSKDWLGHCRIFDFLTFKNSWVAFAVCFGSLSICTMKRCSVNFAPFGWIWAESIFISIQFKFICIVLFTIQIVAKQLYRKWKILQYISSSLSVVAMSSWCTYGRNVR